MLLAKDVLTVIFHGEERAGVTLYAIRPNGIGTRFDLKIPDELATGSHSFRMYGESWEIFGWDVVIDTWPIKDVWGAMIFQALESLIQSGAVAAWMGAEGFVVSDPPSFKPEDMPGSVLAALTSDGSFICSTYPDLPVQPLSDAEVLLLRQHVSGLIDAIQQHSALVEMNRERNMVANIHEAFTE